ncbi:MAG: P-loop NTPase [Sulfuriferula sp.]
MRSDDIDKVKELICPLINKGEISLLLGAGFSLGNITETGSGIPSGDGLRDMLLKKAGTKAGARTSLKDAYLFASRKIPEFQDFLAKCFTVQTAKPWQEKMFKYVWSRIYTTNIDNVLEIAFKQAKSKGILGAEFSFFNFTEPQLASSSIGTVPVVSIHGSIKKLADGFIFSNFEYANAGSRTLDWHNELAAKIMVGGLVVIGNQLDEADIDSHLAARLRLYGEISGGQNWIVMPSPDEIKRENYIAAGFDVIDATAEEFFESIFSNLTARSIDEIIQDTVPASKTARVNLKARSWFKEAFCPVLTELDRVSKSVGILRHFMTGVDPDWFYISNSAHAATSRISELIKLLGIAMKAQTDGVSIINVVGPSGSGKTTTIRAALYELIKTYPYVYEYESANGIDVDLLFEIVSAFSGKSVIVFYSAAEYYYAVNAIANRLRDKKKPHCLFILEDRAKDYKKNERQLEDCKDISSQFEMGRLIVNDAISIALKIDEHGLTYEGFSEFSIEKRANIIVDKERGYGGDLLSTLFSLTTHENFEQKIYLDYHSVEGVLPHRILDVAAIMNTLGFQIPIKYVAGFLQTSVEQIVSCLNADLLDIVLCPAGKLNCRHRVIAEYYFDNCISGHGSVEFIMGILEYISRQFSIEDIKYHPIAYQIYKKIISFNFLYDKYFQEGSRRIDTEKTYHEAQKVYGKDGVFWLHFGRFYRKIGELDNAIDCFRTGLIHYNSFQTRHSLGTALVDKYIESGCTDESAYEEGVALLETERLGRGNSDAYPTSTLCDLLLKILSINPSHKDASRRLKECINFGIKYFKEDEFFQRKMKEYLAIKR